MSIRSPCPGTVHTWSVCFVCRCVKGSNSWAAKTQKKRGTGRRKGENEEAQGDEDAEDELRGVVWQFKEEDHRLKKENNDGGIPLEKHN